MKQFVVALAALAVTGLPAWAQDAEAGSTPSAEDAVRAAVMDYFEGGNAGDSDRVRSAFAADEGAMYVLRTDDTGEDRIEVVNLGDFAARFSRPITSGRVGEIQEIRIVNDAMAFAHFHFTSGERVFDDFFTLYNINGEWKIVSKAYTVQ